MFVLAGGSRVVIPRTELTYPGHDPRLHRNAADRLRSPVDAVMIDFESACPRQYKGERSRRVTIEALNSLDFGDKVVSVRPNDSHSPFFVGDLEAVVLHAPNRFHGIVLAKVRSPEEVVHVSRVLDDLEQRGGWASRLQIEVLIETPEALLRAYAIATASERMCGLIFGIAGMAASLGIREIVDGQNRNFHFAKQSMIVAAKAAGLHAIDGAYPRLVRLDDPPAKRRAIEAALREKTIGAAALGMDGTWIIHPQQARIANECFSPTPKQVAHAKAMVETCEAGVGEIAISAALVTLVKAAQSGGVDAAYLEAQAARARCLTGNNLLDLVRRTS